MAQAATQQRTNGFDKKLVQSYVDRLETIASDASSEIGKAMKKKKDDTNVILDEAKQEGIGKRPLKALVARRQLLKKAGEASADLSPEDFAQFDKMNDALGDYEDEFSAPVGADE